MVDRISPAPRRTPVPVLASKQPQGTVTASRTVTIGDGLLFVDSAAGTITLSLPSAARTQPGQELLVVHLTGANDVLVAPDGTDTIGGATGSLSLQNSQAVVVRLISDGVSAWAVASRGTSAAGVVIERITTIPGGDGAGNVGDLDTNPVTIVPAAPAGFYNQLLDYHAFLDFAAAAYDGNPTTDARYVGGADVATQIAAGFLNGGADAHRVAMATGTTPLAATAIELYTSAPPFVAAGDSPLIVRAHYRLETLDFA